MFLQRKKVQEDRMFTRKFDFYNKISYISVLGRTFGTVMFNLGSMLLWALGRTVVPENAFLRTVIGVGGAAGTLYLGRMYLNYVDSLVPHPSKK